MFTNPIENPLGRKGLNIFNDNFSERSSSIKERVQDKKDEAIEMIKKFASGYYSTGFKITVDSFSNTIKSVQLLSGYSANTHKEEEVGRRLYDDLYTVIKFLERSIIQIFRSTLVF